MIPRKGDKLTAIGYRLLKDENKKKWPEWLLKGEHRVSNVKTNGFGTLVKTDRQNEWMNIEWFRVHPKEEKSCCR